MKKIVALVAGTALASGGVAAAATAHVAASSSNSNLTYNAVTPTRLVDTRTTAAVVANGHLTVSTGETTASAVVVNVTVTGSSNSGNLTVDPAGVAETATSNVNFSAGQTVANEATVATDGSGNITVWNNSPGKTQVIIDLEGYYSSGPNPAPSSTASTTPAPTTTTPAPTTSSPVPTTSSPAPTSTGLPVAPAGYTDVFYDGFTKTAPLGTFGTTDGGKTVYTGDHGGGWTSYPDGWSSTNSSCGYNPATVASVDSHGLDFALHTNAANAAVCPGKPVGANLHPDVYPTAASNAGYFTYGRVSVTMQLASSSPAYHAVPLLWPINDPDWQSAESDFPEFDTSAGAPVDAYAHYGGSGSQDDFTVPATVNGKPFSVLDSHTYTQQWTPTGTSYFVDGQLIGTSTHRTWSNPEREQLQFEPSGSAGADAHVYVTNFEIDQYNGASTTPVPTTSSPAPTTSSPPPTGTTSVGPAHTVVLLEENHNASDVIGNSAAPYLTGLAGTGVNYSDYVGYEHPSLPNYLELYSGSDQGQNGNDNCIASSAANLGSALGAGNVKEFAEGLPSDPTQDSGAYACRHNPLAQFTDAASKAGENSFAAFPQTAAGWAALPKVSYVTPNLNDDEHDGSVAASDAWAKTNLDGYVQWAKANHSVLVVVCDENASDTDLTTPTFAFIAGASITPSTQSAKLGHQNLFKTIEDWYGVPAIGNTVGAADLPGLPAGF